MMRFFVDVVAPTGVSVVGLYYLWYASRHAISRIPAWVALSGAAIGFVSPFISTIEVEVIAKIAFSAGAVISPHLFRRYWSDAVRQGRIDNAAPTNANPSSTSLADRLIGS